MKDKICRFCFQTITNNNCQAVEESLLKSLKLNINISMGNVMCIACANCLRVFSNITSGCILMEDGVLPSSDFQNNDGLHPLHTQATSSLKSAVKTEIKCSFCANTHEREDLISLNESKGNKPLVNMLEQYISQMNLKITEELLTCATCLEALRAGLSVILNCLDLEKIRKIELESMDDKGQVELNEAQRLISGPIIKSEIESFSVDKFENRSDQIQEGCAGMAKAEIKREREINDMELIIKTEDNIPDIKLEESDCDCDGFQISAAEKNISNHPTPTSAVISEKRKYKDRIKQCLLTQKKMFHCEICPYMTKHTGHLKEHLLIHKSPSEITMFKCEMCPYEAKLEIRLRRHLLTHKSPSEMKMFKCESCSYETKQKYRLKYHSMTHKNPSEIKMFKCGICPYEAKLKVYLRQHLLTHKNPAEIHMFKCEVCPYEAKRKIYLKQHLLTHKSPAEIKMFKCQLCSYEAKQKSSLQGHLWTHKSPSERNKLKCELCLYETKRKVNLRRHLFIHKSPTETFKCATCSYETKRKSALKVHLSTHNNPSEIKMFKCGVCSHETKHKSSLRVHLLTHKSLSEIKTFKCGFCSHETKYKSALKAHLLIHKSPSEIKMFKCELCSYEAKRKALLRQHLLTHKSLSEIRMFKCESCSYEAKRKSDLIRHLFTH